MRWAGAAILSCSCFLGILASPPSARSAAGGSSLEAARDGVEALARQVVDTADTTVHMSREAVSFTYLYAGGTAQGLAVRIAVTDSTACPVDTLERALLASGWIAEDAYAADGPDGHVMGFVRSGTLCVLDARWDGGDDSDPSYVPVPGCEITVTCVPRREDDVPPR